jgi:hypothetical protein
MGVSVDQIRLAQNWDQYRFHEHGNGPSSSIKRHGTSWLPERLVFLTGIILVKFVIGLGETGLKLVVKDG